MNIRYIKTIGVSCVVLLSMGGIIAVATIRNDFTIKNSEAAPSDPEVYISVVHADVESGILVEPEEGISRLRILPTGIGYLNVRSGPSAQNRKVGQVVPGEIYEYIEVAKGWYRISHSEIEAAWVSGEYVEKLENE